MLQSIQLCKVFLLNFSACGWFLTVSNESYWVAISSGTVILPRKDTPGNSWLGCAARFSKYCPYFRPKKVIFHIRFQRTRTRFQTWPRRNYVIITKNSNNKDFFKIHFQCVCFSFFLSHKEFLDSQRSLENHTRFQTKTDKVYTRFQTKTAKKP